MLQAAKFFRWFTVFVCLLVIVVLASSHGPRNRQFFARARIYELVEALSSYQKDIGEFPNDLEALVSNPGVAGWKGPYLRHGAPLDAWGRPYIYKMVPEILSFGADGVPGGKGPNADISSRHLDDLDDAARGQESVFFVAVAGFLGLTVLPPLIRLFIAGFRATHQNFQSPA